MTFKSKTWWIFALVNFGVCMPELFFGRETDWLTAVNLLLAFGSAVAAVWSTETRDER